MHFPALGDNDVLFGQNKIFMRVPTLNVLEYKFKNLLEVLNQSALAIQRSYFRHKQLNKLRRGISCVRKLQTEFRVRQEHKKLTEKRMSIRCIQRWIRYQKKRQKMKSLIRCSGYIQALVKTIVQYNYYQQVQTKIVTLQDFTKYCIEVNKQKKQRFIDNLVKINSFNLCWNYLRWCAATKIQSYARLFIVKQRYPEVIQSIERAGVQYRYKRAAIKIQKVARGYIVCQRIKRMSRAARHIQGFFRSIWLHQLFRRVRRAATVIQRFIRRYQQKYGKNSKLFLEYIKKIDDGIEMVKLSEECNLFNPKNLVEQTLQKSHEATYSKKMYLFSYLVDIEVLTDFTDIYDALWSDYYITAFKEAYEKMNYINYLAIGEAHTLAICTSGKIYAWGWNDSGQLGVPAFAGSEEQGAPDSGSKEAKLLLQRDASSPPRAQTGPAKESGDKGQLQPPPVKRNLKLEVVQLPAEMSRVRQVSAGANHNLALDALGNVFSWGQNAKGQLGLNHFTNVDAPSKLTLFPVGTTFRQVKASGNKSYAVTTDGKLYHWPVKKSNGNLLSYPVELPLLKTQVAYMSCGNSFVILQTTHGLLYSFGDNRKGQLGLGHTNAVQDPTILGALRDSGEKICNVECGFKHVVAKSTLGRVFTWGWGERGQLGHGSLLNELTPRLLRSRYFTSDKVIQVTAGFQCSLMMTENRKIYWCGSNSTIRNFNEPVEFQVTDRSKMIAQDFYQPIRVVAAWSNILSVIYVTYANIKNAFDKQPIVKKKVLYTMTQKWCESQLDTGKAPPPNRAARAGLHPRAFFWLASSLVRAL